MPYNPNKQTDNKQYFKPFNCVKKKSSGLFKNIINKKCLQIIYI